MLVTASDLTLADPLAEGDHNTQRPGVNGETGSKRAGAKQGAGGGAHANEQGG
jgi:hypothetical protein